MKGSWVVALIAMAVPVSAAAQQFPGVGGVEFRLGVATPEDLTNEELANGFSISGDVDLGWVSRPWLRFIAGVNYFSFDVQEADTAVGDASNFAVRGGVRADAFGDRRTAASLLAAMSVHSVSADAPSRGSVADLLEGVYVGLTIGAGVRYALDDQARAAVVAELRRTFVTNVDHWAFEGGIRYMVRGTRAYLPPPEAPPGAVGFDDRDRLDAEARREAERERLREAERLRAEEQARMERDTRAQSEAEAAQRELEQARARADSLERARQSEEQARAEAEARANEAAAAAEAAEARAVAAERRLGEAFAELDRILINIAGVTETPRGLVVTLGSGMFATGQSSLTQQSRGEVGRIARVLQEFPERDVLIEGHTDSVGEETNNQALSERRAEAVRAALIAEGVSPRRITALGYGESRPVSDNETPAGRAANRRVEIVVLHP